MGRFSFVETICYDRAMISWAAKRKLEYLGIILLVIFLPFGIFAYIHFSKAPTCSDGKQNGSEEGVDCGGACLRLCSFQTIAPIIHFQRMSKVGPGLYNTLAYVENSNQTAGVRSISYTFKLYDKDGVVIARRFGSTFLPPKKISPIFEGAVDTGQRTAARVTFEFTADPVWEKYTKTEPDIALSGQVFSNPDTAPLLEVDATNRSPARIEHADFVAILYDEKGNAMAFSRTAQDKIAKAETRHLTFTWREPFPSVVSKIEIIPRIDF